MEEEKILSDLAEIKDILKPIVISTGTKVIVPRKINDRFTDNGDGTISDNLHKIEWVKDPTQLGEVFCKKMTFEEAEKACKELSFINKTGWRMPTLQEEFSIRDYKRSNPAWDIDIFGGNFDDWYWTSETCAWNSGAAWCVSSLSGYVFNYGKVELYYVRPVRSSQ